MKAVGESMQNPLLYHKNNLIGTINLLETMKKHACYQLVFSSSCTIYGTPKHLPITEEHEIGNVTNVYGKTKYFIEEILKDITKADKVRIIKNINSYHFQYCKKDLILEKLSFLP